MTRSLHLLIAVGLLVSFEVLACRYSVRDTGFVDIGDDNYRLVLKGRDLGDLTGLYRGICAASLLDSNITFEAREEPDAEGPTLALEDSSGRRLVLAEGAGLPTNLGDAATLVESVSMSPLRAEIHEQSLNAFAVVLLVEGGPAGETARIKASINRAIENIRQLMPSMPKPVDTPPSLISITPEMARGERVTLWGLGFDPSPADEPRVSIVYGRGRRIGDSLDGPLVTQTVLQERLSIIGQDCECELDRKWMKGPLFPGRWDADRQKQAVRALGFDPENPMVRAEVSRIVLRGPGTGRLRKLSGGSSALGYSEVLVDEIPVVEPGVPGSASATTPPESASSPTLATATPPLEQTRRITWFMVFGSAAVVLVAVVFMWRKIRKEQG